MIWKDKEIQGVQGKEEEREPLDFGYSKSAKLGKCDLCHTFIGLSLLAIAISALNTASIAKLTRLARKLTAIPHELDG